MTAEGWPEGQSPWTDFAKYLALRCENRFQFIRRGSDTRTTKRYFPLICEEPCLLRNGTDDTQHAEKQDGQEHLVFEQCEVTLRAVISRYSLFWRELG